MSSTTSTGSPEPAAEIEPPPSLTPRQRLASGLVVLGAAAVLLLLTVAGIHLVGVLYGVVYPPLPPIYSNMTEVGHVNEAHGVDRWRYITRQSPVDVVNFYTAQGGICAAHGSNNPFMATKVPMTCTGRGSFSIFSMGWQVVITPDNPQTDVLIDREVYWIGQAPMPTLTSVPPPSPTPRSR